METNNIFSFRRLVLLCKQSLILNRKMIVIALTGFVGVLMIAMFFFQAMSEFKNWQNRDSEVVFVSLFITLGILYSGLSFPAFRSKEKTMAYLMLPATSSEKFVFEILTRIIVFILLIPFIFWVVANIEGALVHNFVPELINYKFSFVETHTIKSAPLENEAWITFAIAQGILFVFIAPFTGASHFSKSPLLKTLFTLTMIVAGYFIFIYLTFKGLSLNEFDADKNHILFITNKNNALIAFAIAATILNLCLITISFFRLKEKEA